MTSIALAICPPTHWPAEEVLSTCLASAQFVCFFSIDHFTLRVLYRVENDVQSLSGRPKVKVSLWNVFSLCRVKAGGGGPSPHADHMSVDSPFSANGVSHSRRYSRESGRFSDSGHVSRGSASSAAHSYGSPYVRYRDDDDPFYRPMPRSQYRAAFGYDRPDAARPQGIPARYSTQALLERFNPSERNELLPGVQNGL
jgi:hypothetical protein